MLMVHKSAPATFSPDKFVSRRASHFFLTSSAKVYGRSSKRFAKCPLISCKGSQSSTVYCSLLKACSGFRIRRDGTHWTPLSRVSSWSWSSHLGQSRLYSSRCLSSSLSSATHNFEKGFREPGAFPTRPPSAKVCKSLMDHHSHLSVWAWSSIMKFFTPHPPHL